ncbi:hypothetical protein ACSBR1_001977 [Camellia fascicularis]
MPESPNLHTLASFDPFSLIPAVKETTPIPSAGALLGEKNEAIWLNPSLKKNSNGCCPHPKPIRVQIDGYTTTIASSPPPIVRHGLKQLKNKYMSLKKEWNAWKKLMDSSKGITRIGFDSETGLFQASNA